MNIVLKNIHIENFEGIREKGIDFGKTTWIFGPNAAGKTTIADAFMWCLFDKNSRGESKFQVRPLDCSGGQIDHVEIKVSLSLEVDGRNVMIQKIQKQNWVKKRGAREKTLQGNVNSFEVDGIPKSEKDFKEYIYSLIAEDLFRLITNPQAFVSKKWQEQRDELMKFAPAIDNDDVIASNPGVLQKLSMALALHTPEDLAAKAKKALSEYNKRKAEIPARIDEVKKSMVVIDLAELELQRNSLKEQIAEMEKSEGELTELYECYLKETGDLMTLKMQLADMERQANEDNNAARRKYEDELVDLERSISSAERKIGMLEQNITDGEATIAVYEKKRQELLGAWKEEKAKKYAAHMEMDESATICPTCGQIYPPGKLAEIRSNFEKTKLKLKEQWEAQHREKLNSIHSDGNKYKNLINNMQEKVEQAKRDLATMQNELDILQEKKEKTSDSLSRLPDKIDLSDDPEYQNLSAEIFEKEKSLAPENKAEKMRQQIREKKDSLKEELLRVEQKFVSADNSARELRLEELQKEMEDVSNAANEQEEMLYLLDEFAKAKATMVSGLVNEKFNLVNWKLFKKQINGAVVECCECTVSGIPFSELNTGHRIAAGLDIINSLSELYGVSAPIFIDNAEAINSFNLPKLNSQMILLSVSDDKEMRVEVA